MIVDEIADQLAATSSETGDVGRDSSHVFQEGQGQDRVLPDGL
jgi:hypothetical protein